jgi:hypothetical protein
MVLATEDNGRHGVALWACSLSRIAASSRTSREPDNLRLRLVVLFVHKADVPQAERTQGHFQKLPHPDLGRHVVGQCPEADRELLQRVALVAAE